MPCVKPLNGYVAENGGWQGIKPDDRAPIKMRVPCGQCLGCRIDRRKQWGARIMHEASEYRDNSFLTLTYRDKIQCNKHQLKHGFHMPESGSLVKSHHQKFMKRLRHHYPDRRIRYYQCGEYGDETNRPHYHSCLFNLSFHDEQLYSQNHGNPLFTSETLENLWGYGFATVGDLTYESAQYVAGYVLAKVTGARADDHYHRIDERGNSYWLQPEYATMSTGAKKGDGIGAAWFKTYHEDVFPDQDMPVPGVGIVRGIPRYYGDLYADISPAGMAEVTKLRKQFAASHPERYTQQALDSQHKIYKANIKERQL